MVTIATAISNFYYINRYFPSLLSSLDPDYMRVVPKDPKWLDACNLASTSDGSFWYRTYINGWLNGDKDWFMLFSQVERGGIWLWYGDIYILTGTSPCSNNWYQVANSVCTSKPGRTTNNSSWIAYEATKLQQLVSNLFLPSEAHAQTSPPTCNGKVATIWVNSSTNKIVWWTNSWVTYNGSNLVWTTWYSTWQVIVWTNGADTINASTSTLWFNDTICGVWGNDIIYWYNGLDWIDGWDGNDTIYWGTDNDTIYGWNGDDTIQWNEDNDLIYGWDGNDTIQWNSQDDILYGQDGDDTLDGADGIDTLYGWNGNDMIAGWSQADTLYWWDGNDTMSWDSDADRLAWWDGNDIIDWGSQNDVIYGNEWNDTLMGSYWDDWISWWNGWDSFQWWYGSNTCSDYSPWTDSVVNIDASNLSCNSNAGTNGWRNGFDPGSCTSISFDPACNSDYDGDGISNVTEWPTANSDAVNWYPADSLLNRQDSNIVDADWDGAVNQLDPNNTDPCIPSSSAPWCTPQPISNPTIVWVNCAAITSLPPSSRAYHVLIY